MTNSAGLPSFIYRKRFLWLLIVAGLCIVADQASKIWAQSNLAQSFETIEYKEIDGIEKPVTVVQHYATREIVVIPSAFSLQYKENPAAAFSITSSFPEWFRRPFLVIVSIFASFFFLFMYFRTREKNALLLTSFCLILGGAVGNLIDRVRLGYVIDFLDVHATFLGYPNLHWPTFNIADSCIVVGAILMLFCTLFPQATSRG